VPKPGSGAKVISSEYDSTGSVGSAGSFLALALLATRVNRGNWLFGFF
jgi:hypothetical protein